MRGIQCPFPGDLPHPGVREQSQRGILLSFQSLCQLREWRNDHVLKIDNITIMFYVNKMAGKVPSLFDSYYYRVGLRSRYSSRASRNHSFALDWNTTLRIVTSSEQVFFIAVGRVSAISDLGRTLRKIQEFLSG